MIAVVLVYQQVENNLLTPTIQGKAVNISAFFIIVSVALFSALLGAAHITAGELIPDRLLSPLEVQSLA